MKYALIAVIITMLFALQSAFAAESAMDIAADLIDSHELPENLPQSVKKAKAVKEEAAVEVQDDVITEEASAPVEALELPEAVAATKFSDLDNMDALSEDSVEAPASAPAQDERQPAAAEEVMIAEAPGTIDFDMATIDMIPDALPEAKPSYKEIAKSK